MMKNLNPWLRSLFNAALVLVVGVTLMLILAVLQKGGWLTTEKHDHETAEGASDSVYTCPMHPQIRQPNQGMCPICGMALEKATQKEDHDHYAVHLDPVSRRLAHIKTAPVRRISLTRTIEAEGSLAYAESRLATVIAYAEGRIEKQYANYTGMKIKKGNKLVELFSPRLIEAQEAFLTSLETLKEMQRDGARLAIDTQRKLVAQSRRQLLELGLTDDQVREVEKKGRAFSRLTLNSPIDGTIIERKVVQGNEVKRGQVLYRLADLTFVWLMLDLFPQDAALIRYGQKVEAEVRSHPGRRFRGRVAFISPEVTESTRTVKVRVEMRNFKGQLRPGDLARAKIQINPGVGKWVYDEELAGKYISPMHPEIIRDQPGICPICKMPLVSTEKHGYARSPVATQTSLVVPREAVLTVGDKSVVYVETNPGRFEIRPVKVASLTKEHAILALPVPRPFWEFYPAFQMLSIPGMLPFSNGHLGFLPNAITQPWDALLGGVREGEKVATAGNFLIDSQMQLEGKPSLIDVHQVRIDLDKWKREQAIAKLSPEDQKLANRQKICPVTRAPLGSMGVPLKVKVQDRAVFICCQGCEKMLKKKPEMYLKRIPR